MKPKFIDTAVIATFLAAAVLASCAHHQGYKPALEIAVGAIWGSCNLLFLKCFFISLITPAAKNLFKIVILLTIKWPVLYLAGYALLKIAHFSPMYFGIGFALTFGIMLALVCAQWLLLRTTSRNTWMHYE
jgi:hypothetical protein